MALFKGEKGRGKVIPRMGPPLLGQLLRVGGGPLLGPLLACKSTTVQGVQNKEFSVISLFRRVSLSNTLW